MFVWLCVCFFLCVFFLLFFVFVFVVCYGLLGGRGMEVEARDGGGARDGGELQTGWERNSMNGCDVRGSR